MTLKVDLSKSKMSTSNIKVIQVLLYETKHYIQYVNDHESDHVLRFCGEILAFLIPLLLNCEKTFVGDGYYLNKVFYNSCKF